jgi:transcriptional regulator with XRE-family HTH domain
MKERARYPDLPTYLKETQTRQEDFAAKCRIPQGYVSKLARGTIVPRPGPVRDRICRIARIPDASFRLLKLRHLQDLARARRDEIAILDQQVREALA